jgi:hypothetical protein
MPHRSAARVRTGVAVIYTLSSLAAESALAETAAEPHRTT